MISAKMENRWFARKKGTDRRAFDDEKDELIVDNARTNTRIHTMSQKRKINIGYITFPTRS